MTAPRPMGRKERIARAAVGMPALHPELITHSPSQAEWKQLAAWCIEMWPNDEYTAIVTESLRQDPPSDWRRQ